MQDEKIVPVREPGEKVFKKLDNFWYHNKWKVIIFSFFVVVFLVCTLQFCQKGENDLYIMYAGPRTLGRAYTSSLRSAISEVVPSRDGEGKGSFEIVELWVPSDEQIKAGKAEIEAEGEIAVVNYEALSSNYEAFSQHMWAGDTVICLLDPALYSTVYVEGDDGQMKSGFMKLEDVLGYTPDYAYDEYSVRLKDTPLAKEFKALRDIDTDDEKILLCIREKSAFASIFDRENTDEYHAYCVEVFKNFFEYQPK